jgi:U4/U6.U5 tri-snRNP-associated protein 2
MSLIDGAVWCLPDGYRVIDRSLDDISAFMNPKFTSQDLNYIDQSIRWSRAIDGTEYMPGLVGLNNMKANDYANVIIQILARVQPIRNFFLILDGNNENYSPLVFKTGELLRKIWFPKQFKGQVSPHEFMQAVMLESKKTFLIDKKGEPMVFMMWLLNTLHSQLTNSKTKSNSIITETFQGGLEMKIMNRKELKTENIVEHETHSADIFNIPFLTLGLDLPPTPIFKNTCNRMQIPQVPLSRLIKKYDAKNCLNPENSGKNCYRITKLPNYLIIWIKRFRKNAFFWEKNPSIVNFPIKNLDLKDISPSSNNSDPIYDLIASIVHEGNIGLGIYKIYIHRKLEDKWYEVQDLSVVEVLPQMVALTEAYLQVYERKVSLKNNDYS